MNTTQLKEIGIRVNQDGTIPVWAWNGWNSQWVQSGMSGLDLLSQAGEAKAKGDEVIQPEDGLVIVKHEYDFYGWRSRVMIYTTVPGRVVLDKDDNLLGDWIAEQ